jgi:Flp pilus assembly protein TadD
VTVAFSPDGARLATCSAGAALWDAATARPLVQPWQFERAASFNGYDCRFSPDGRWLMTGGPSVRLWDALTGAPGMTFAGMGGVFSPRGDRLATMAGRNVVVSIVASGRALTPPLELEGSSYATSVDFSSDGRWIVAAGEDVRVWDAGTGTLLAVLDRRSWTAGQGRKGAVFLPTTNGVALGDITLVEGQVARSRVWRFARDARPVADLIEVASLLAGYRVVSETDAPVNLTSAELQHAWDRFGEAGGPDVATSKEKVVAWHRRLADEAAEEGRHAEALAHLDAAIALGPPRATMFERRGHARAELGRWAEAEEDFRQAAQLRSGFPDLLSHAALLRAARGDAGGQRQIASDLVRESGRTGNPDRAYWIARTCALVPDGAALDRDLLVRLAELALPLSGQSAEILDLRGAALHRAGRYQEARQRLLAAVTARGRATTWEAAFLAVANHRAHLLREARHWLERGEAAARDPKSTWTERLEGQVLLAEARSLLGAR